MLRFILAFMLSMPFAVMAWAAPAGPAYVGTWSVNPAQCRRGQDQQGAPLIVKAKRLDQHEAHCEFGSVRAAGEGRWTVQATCTVEGNKERRTMSLRVAGERLTVAWGDGVTTTYRKCASR